MQPMMGEEMRGPGLFLEAPRNGVGATALCGAGSCLSDTERFLFPAREVKPCHRSGRWEMFKMFSNLLS